MASDLTPEELAAFRIMSRQYLVTMAGDTVGRLVGMAERCADYDRRLSEVMPKDFKDWWQNSRQCWPEMAAWSITNLRQREDWAHAQMARALDECEGMKIQLQVADRDAAAAREELAREIKRHREEAERFDSEEWTKGRSDA